VPSALAALVVFFFPVATHLAFPLSHYLRDYRVPIPWTATALSLSQGGLDLVVALVSSTGEGRFGVTPFWNRKPAFSSLMSFSSWTDVDTIDYVYAKEAVREGATQVVHRQFMLGGLPLSCWQYLPTKNVFRNPLLVGGSIWTVNCETPPRVRQRNLYASFYGMESDIPAFYKVIEGVRPVE